MRQNSFTVKPWLVCQETTSKSHKFSTCFWWCNMFSSLTARCSCEGVNLKPSMRIATGTNKTREIMVIIEKRLMLSKASCFNTTNFNRIAGFNYEKQRLVSWERIKLLSYLFNHEFFTENIAWLVRHIRRHCAAETNPGSLENTQLKPS